MQGEPMQQLFFLTYLKDPHLVYTYLLSFTQNTCIMKWNKTITTEQVYEKALARLAIIFKADPDSAEGMDAE